MATIGELFEVVITSTYLNQECKNVFRYQVTAAYAGEISAEICEAWKDTVLPALVQCLSTGLTFNSVAVESLTTPVDFHIEALVANNVGTRSGDQMPPYAAWAFRYNPDRSDRRPGQKRFAGVSEVDTLNGVADSGVRLVLNNLAVILSADLMLGIPTYLAPVIAHDNRKVQPIERGHTGVSSVVYASLSTQNTRKFNR